MQFVYGDFGAWIVIQPIPVNLEMDEDGAFVVSDDIFLAYGMGGTQSEAISDYVSSLIELYQLLERSAENNPLDKLQLGHLQTYLIIQS